MENQQIIKLIKEAKWDCKKINKIYIINNKINYLLKKFPDKFKRSKLNSNIIKIKGIYLSNSQVHKLKKINNKIIIEIKNKCSYCNKNCDLHKLKRENAINAIINEYKNISNKFIKFDLSYDLKQDLNQTICHAIQEAIFYYNFNKKTKFSTHVYKWLEAYIKEFFNKILSNKSKNNDKFIIYDDEKIKNLYYNFDETLNCNFFDILNKKEYLVINFLYNENFNTEIIDKKIDLINEEKNKYKKLALFLKCKIKEIKNIEFKAKEKIKEYCY